jgi:hypothetical protein
MAAKAWRVLLCLMAVALLAGSRAPEIVRNAAETNGDESLAGFAEKAFPEGYWMATVQDLTVAVGQLHYFRSTRLFIATPDRRFFGFGITVRNHEDASIIRVAPANVFLLDDRGQRHRHDVATYDYWALPLQNVNAYPGDLISGGLVFLMEEGASPAQVIFDARPFGPLVAVNLFGPPLPY